MFDGRGNLFIDDDARDSWHAEGANVDRHERASGMWEDDGVARHSQGVTLPGGRQG